VVLSTLPVGLTAGVGSVPTGRTRTGIPQSRGDSDVTSACLACAGLSAWPHHHAHGRLLFAQQLPGERAQRD